MVLFLIILLLLGAVFKLVSIIVMPSLIGKPREPYTAGPVAISTILNLCGIVVAIWAVTLLVQAYMV